jgi:hypothetical protein
MNTGPITPHFFWSEVTRSETAARKGIDNSLPNSLTQAVVFTSVQMEKVRNILGYPINISSWYRSQTLNSALGSKPTSQHIKGEAVDFESPAFGSPLKICKKLIELKTMIPFDQLILEHTWVHISFCAVPTVKPRGQVLSLLNSGSYAPGLTDKEGNPL